MDRSGGAYVAPPRSPRMRSFASSASRTYELNSSQSTVSELFVSIFANSALSSERVASGTMRRNVATNSSTSRSPPPSSSAASNAALSSRNATSVIGSSGCHGGRMPEPRAAATSASAGGGRREGIARDEASVAIPGRARATSDGTKWRGERGREGKQRRRGDDETAT